MLLLAPIAAQSKEVPVGPHVTQNGLEVAAVYLQPIEMDPPGMMREAAQSDVHLEADIRAAKDNRNGFAEGDWVPALDVKFELVKLDGDKPTDQKVDGPMMQMVANDGPHYGDNVKLFGPGRYRLKLTIAPPGAHSHFGRHVDKETGVGPWFAPFEVTQDFTFAGIGKKGAY
nr:iron transporter [Methylobacterium brachythecii]